MSPELLRIWLPASTRHWKMSSRHPQNLPFLILLPHKQTGNYGQVKVNQAVIIARYATSLSGRAARSGGLNYLK